MQKYFEVRALFEPDQIVENTGYRRAQKRAQGERRRPDAGQQTVSVYVVGETAFAAKKNRIVNENKIVILRRITKMCTYNAAVMESTNVGTQIIPNATPWVIRPITTNSMDLENETIVFF